MSLLRFCSQVTKEVNNMTVKMPNQCFINGRFEDAESGKAYNTINPTDGSVSGGGGGDAPCRNSNQTDHCVRVSACL